MILAKFRRFLFWPLGFVANRAMIWMCHKHVVEYFDSIPIVSISENQDDCRMIVTKALELIRDHDPQRYERVKKHARFIVNSAHPGGVGCGAYRRRTQIVELDVEYNESVGDLLFHAAHFAAVIVHEVTHGVICKKGIISNRDNRVQVERICVAEQNRFLRKLLKQYPELPEDIVRTFDPNNWSEAWGWSRFERFRREMKRAERKWEVIEESGRTLRTG